MSLTGRNRQTDYPARAAVRVLASDPGVEGVLRQEVEPLALPLAATLAPHPTHLDLQNEARVAARQIANAPRPSVVPAPVRSSTATA